MNLRIANTVSHFVHHRVRTKKKKKKKKILEKIVCSLHFMKQPGYDHGQTHVFERGIFRTIHTGIGAKNNMDPDIECHVYAESNVIGRRYTIWYVMKRFSPELHVEQNVKIML